MHLPNDIIRNNTKTPKRVMDERKPSIIVPSLLYGKLFVPSALDV